MNFSIMFMTAAAIVSLFLIHLFIYLFIYLFLGYYLFLFKVDLHVVKNC